MKACSFSLHIPPYVAPSAPGALKASVLAAGVSFIAASLLKNYFRLKEGVRGNKQQNPHQEWRYV